MDKFDLYKSELLTGFRNLLKENFDDLPEQALSDAEHFFKTIEDDLRRWTKLMAAGELTEQDFKYLVKGKEGLLEILVLTQTGLAMTRVERFRRSLLNLIIDNAFDVFFPG